MPQMLSFRPIAFIHKTSTTVKLQLPKIRSSLLKKPGKHTHCPKYLILFCSSCIALCRVLRLWNAYPSAAFFFWWLLKPFCHINPLQRTYTASHSRWYLLNDSSKALYSKFGYLCAACMSGVLAYLYKQVVLCAKRSLCWYFFLSYAKIQWYTFKVSLRRAKSPSQTASNGVIGPMVPVEHGAWLHCYICRGTVQSRDISASSLSGFRQKISQSFHLPHSLAGLLLRWYSSSAGFLHGLPFGRVTQPFFIWRSLRCRRLTDCLIYFLVRP